MLKQCTFSSDSFGVRKRRDFGGGRGEKKGNSNKIS